MEASIRARAPIYRVLVSKGYRVEVSHPKKTRYTAKEKIKARARYYTMREERAIKDLKEIKEILDEVNVRYWLDCGTLLGAVRDGKIIEWDNYIDLGTMILRKILSAIPGLEKRGFDIALDPHPLYNNIFFGRWIDLFRFVKVSILLYQIKARNAIRSGSTPAYSGRISRRLKQLYELLISSPHLDFLKSSCRSNAAAPLVSLLPHKLRKPVSNLVWWAWIKSGLKFHYVIIPKYYFKKLDTKILRNEV